jgi:two-component system, NarL family, captular synthesis response regulator RcsB
MRIFVADDHPVVLMGVRALLAESFGSYEIVGEAYSGQDLLSWLGCPPCPCDLVITDFSMPTDDGAVDGLSMIRAIRHRHPTLPILILTMLNNLALIQGMLAVGGCAVVEKSAMTKELVLAIRAMSRGRGYLSDRLRKGLEEHRLNYQTDAAKAGPALSSRQAEVVRLLAKGWTVTEIARNTLRSIKTVSQQKHEAMRKLGITADNQLFEYMRAHGF